MNTNPQELIILTPPADAESSDSSLLDVEIARLLGDSVAAESPVENGETLRIQLAIAGGLVFLDIPPWAIEGFVIDRYCADGWTAVNELRASVVWAIVGPEIKRRDSQLFGARREAASAGPRHELFVRAMDDSIALLEELVSEAIMRIAADALRVATKRIADLKRHLDRQDARYGLAAAETERPEGAGGRPGSDNAAPGVDNPKVKGPADAAEATALGVAVRRLVAARQRAKDARRAQSTTGLDGAEGAGGSDSETKRDTLDPAADRRIADADRAYVEVCGQVTMGTDGHTIAPAVFALLRSDQVFEDFTDEAIFATAFAYLRNTRAALSRALPAEFPFRNLRERLGMSIAAVATERPPNAIDRPELRAALWASERHRGYAYEPLDDESILDQLLNELAATLAAAGDDDSLAVVFRYRVLAELIKARDTRDDIVLMKKAAKQTRMEKSAVGEANRAAGMLGLLGLAFPPAHLPAAGLGLYAAAGHALAAIRDIDPENREIDAKEIQALLASDRSGSERYAQLVASRPSVTRIIWQVLGALATFSVIGKVSRTVAVGLQVYFDLTAVEPRVETWVTAPMRD